mmetsp:Transcript_57926/g.169352  ORF Transcript_57926/g.169352 Transcript_57926/m.169352 type:complete len:229 (-) Transcript_57926:66-752(-)
MPVVDTNAPACWTSTNFDHLYATLVWKHLNLGAVEVLFLSQLNPMHHFILIIDLKLLRRLTLVMSRLLLLLLCPAVSALVGLGPFVAQSIPWLTSLNYLKLLLAALGNNAHPTLLFALVTDKDALARRARAYLQNLDLAVVAQLPKLRGLKILALAHDDAADDSADIAHSERIGRLAVVGSERKRDVNSGAHVAALGKLGASKELRRPWPQKLRLGAGGRVLQDGMCL